MTDFPLEFLLIAVKHKIFVLPSSAKQQSKKLFLI